MAPPSGGSQNRLMLMGSAVANALVLMLTCAVLVTTLPSFSRYHTILWRTCMQSIILAAVLRLMATVGPPQLRPFSLPALQKWFAQVTGTSDLHYLMSSMLMMPQRPSVLLFPAMVSPALLAALRLASFAQKQVPSLESVCAPFLRQREELFWVMAYLDIASLPLVVVTCLMRRSFLLPFAFTQMLRSRYHSPTGYKYHQRTWQQIGARLQPYIHKAPPQVQTGVRWVQQWFTAPPGGVQQPQQR